MSALKPSCSPINSLNQHSKPLVLLLFTNLAPLAQAAPPQIPNSGLLLRESRPLPELPKPKPQVEIENIEQQRPAMQPQNNLQVTVQYFRFTGNTQFCWRGG